MVLKKCQHRNMICFYITSWQNIAIIAYLSNGVFEDDAGLPGCSNCADSCTFSCFPCPLISAFLLDVNLDIASSSFLDSGFSSGALPMLDSGFSSGALPMLSKVSSWLLSASCDIDSDTDKEGSTFSFAEDSVFWKGVKGVDSQRLQ